MKTMTSGSTKGSGTNTGFIPTTKGGGTKTGQATGCEVNTVYVPRNYIVGTLCSNQNAISTIGESLFGKSEGTVSCSCGIFLFALLGIGNMEISTYFTANPKISRNGIAGIKMPFLPPYVYGSWVAYATENLPDGTLTLSSVLGCYKDFVMTSLDVSNFSSNTSPTATPHSSYNVSKGLLLYTLYVEGQTNIANCTRSSGTGTTAPSSYHMGFLPTDLCSIWNTTVAKFLSSHPNAKTSEVAECWKNFVMSTVGNNYESYTRKFQTPSFGSPTNRTPNC